MKKKVLIPLIILILIIAAGTAVIFATEPSVMLNGEENETIEVFGSFSDRGASARYMGIDITDKITESGQVNSSVPGTYLLTYSVSLYGKVINASRTVLVKDTLPPEISLLGDSKVYVESVDDFADEGTAAIDNFDGDVSDSVIRTSENGNAALYDASENEREKGAQVIIYTYTATDSSGNTAKTTRTVFIKDITAPVITLNGSAKVSLVTGGSYSERGAVATDNVDGDITTEISSDVNVNVAGTYKVVYTATDSAGNTSSVTRTVTVRNPVKVSVAAGEPLTSGGSYVCLTFDDGPSINNTEKILDLLREYNIKATFFIVDYSNAKTYLVKRMVDEGHTVGIHSKSHDYAAIYCNADAYMEGIYYMQKKVSDDTGYTPFVIRFPGGSSNTVSKKYCRGVMSELAQRATAEGYTYLDWNVDSCDASGNCVSVARLVSSTENALKHGRVNVVLCHDSAAKTTTPEALKEIITYGIDNGYSFIPYSASAGTVHHTIAN